MENCWWPAIRSPSNSFQTGLRLSAEEQPLLIKETAAKLFEASRRFIRSNFVPTIRGRWGQGRKGRDDGEVEDADVEVEDDEEEARKWQLTPSVALRALSAAAQCWLRQKSGEKCPTAEGNNKKCLQERSKGNVISLHHLFSFFHPLFGFFSPHLFVFFFTPCLASNVRAKTFFTRPIAL